MKISNFLLLITLIFSTLFCPSCELSKSGIWINNADEIVAIQLISYENPDCNWIRNKNKVLPSLFYSKMHIIEDLPSEEVESFIEEVPYIEYWIGVDYDSPQSYCLKVVYANCDFLIACFQNGFFAKYNAQNELIDLYGTALLYDNIQSFFKTQIYPKKESH